MKSKYTIDPDNNVIFGYHEGDLELDEVISLIKTQFNNSKLNHRIRATVDLRKTNFLFKPYETKDIINLVTKNIQKTENGKWAFITSTPKQAAMIMFFENLAMKKLPLKIKTFSTHNAAKAWLNIS